MDGVDTRIAGKSAGTAEKIFSSGTTVNASFWAIDVDFSCIGLGEPTRGCLISPRHILTANHYFPAAPTTETFRKPDGTTITRAVTAFINGGEDCYVGILDSDVPTGVTYATVFPPNVLDKLQPYSVRHLPVLSVTQQWQGGVGEVGDFGVVGQMGYTDHFTAGSDNIWIMAPSTSPRSTYSYSLANGDSGRPCFAIINNHLVLLCTWHWGGYGGGPFTTGFISSIDAAMHTLSVNASATTNYQLSTEDLGGF